MAAPMKGKATHPGEILYEEFMVPKKLLFSETAKRLGISNEKLVSFLFGRLSVTDKLAVRLSRFSGTSVAFWKNLQKNYNRSAS